MRYPLIHFDWTSGDRDAPTWSRWLATARSIDPTIPETTIPWILTSIQDDRVQSYTLARRIYSDLGLKRIALLRVNDRYGRFGVMKFRDA